MPSLPRGIKIYRKLRYRKGHGVHSPFVYNLITKVIEEKFPYYIYDDIEKIREEFLKNKTLVSFTSPKGKIKTSSIAKITQKEVHHKRYGALLFRLVNFFKCKYVLHIGASTGIMSFYLATPYSGCSCIALERREKLVLLGQQKNDDLQQKVQFKSGPYSETVKEVLTVQSKFDLIFIDTAYDHKLTDNILAECLKATHTKTILIIDGIKKNKGMIALWKKLKKDPRTGLSIDLHALGLIFFDKNIYKRHYKTYFNYGEKQNIYKNGRQRLNILSRRKKSF